MFSTNKILGTGNERVQAICLEHITNVMLDFVKGYKDFWNDAHSCGDKKTFGSYLKDVSPKRIAKGKERVDLYNSLIAALESPNEEVLNIEQEYMLFHIMDEYIETAECVVPYNHIASVAKRNAEEQLFFKHEVDGNERYVYPNIWYIENTFTRNLVMNDFKQVSKEIYEEVWEDGKTKISKKEKTKLIEEIFEDTMSSIEDISTYRELLDDVDFESYDDIPNIRAI